MIAIVLNTDISCEHICYEIQKLIEKNRNINNGKSLVLTIDIKQIAYDDHSMIPKIEYKPDCTT